MAKKFRNLGDFTDYSAAVSKKDKLGHIVKQAADKSKGNYFLEIKSPRRGVWTIWLMKD